MGLWPIHVRCHIYFRKGRMRTYILNYCWFHSIRTVGIVLVLESPEKIKKSALNNCVFENLKGFFSWKKKSSFITLQKIKWASNDCYTKTILGIHICRQQKHGGGDIIWIAGRVETSGLQISKRRTFCKRLQMLLTVFEQTQRMEVIVRKGHMVWPQASEVNFWLQKQCSHDSRVQCAQCGNKKNSLSFAVAKTFLKSIQSRTWR